MRTWLANIIWDALWIFLRRVHDWIFDPDRNARIRFRNRERWWSYHQRAIATPDNQRDDMRAKAWRIQFDFKTPPDEAIARGDLSKYSGEHQL
jgi:hypothetical protein